MADDRPPGVLTKGDREYLRSEIDYKSKEAESNKKRAIRRRIKNGLLDFQIIENHLQEADRDRIFEQGSKTGGGRGSFVDAVESLIAWLHRGLTEVGFDSIAIFENGIEKGENELGYMKTADKAESEVYISMQTRNIKGVQQAIEKIDNEEPITSRQLFLLIQNDVALNLGDAKTVQIINGPDMPDVEAETVETLFNGYFDSDVELEMINRE